MVEGSWSLDVPRDLELNFRDLRVEGRPAHFEPVELLPVEGEPVELRATWARRVSVAVVADDTGAHLRGVEIVRRRARGAARRLLPTERPPAERLRADAVSPVELDAPAGIGETYWARAPGHAWTVFGLRPETGTTEIEVRLPRAGRLEVEVTDLDPGERAYAMVTHLGDERNLHDGAWLGLDAAGTVAVDSVPPGAYVVKAQVGERWNPVVLGRAEVEVRPGETARVAIAAKALPGAQELVPLAGVLLYTPGLEDEDLHVGFEPLDPALRERRPKLGAWSHPHDAGRGAGAAPFDLGQVLPGSYRARLHPFGAGAEQVVELGPAGDRNLRLAFPALNDVLVLPIGGDGTAPPGKAVGPHREGAAPEDVPATWDEARGGWTL